jgi:hypothetical protein
MEKDLPNQESLQQYLTPAWAAERIFEHYFSNLTPKDRVLEPSCGKGAFLKAIPAEIPAMGVELDPVLAEAARGISGREVLCGDFTTLDIDFEPTAIVGNPPFSMDISMAFLRRAGELLPANGRCGFILPAYLFQTASTVSALARRWSIRQDILPRNLFKTQELLRIPIVFALFTKEKVCTLNGFFLHQELDEINRLGARAKLLLTAPAPGKSAWRNVVDSALAALGGQGSLGDIYGWIEGRRPTENPFWREQVRKVLRNAESYTRVTEGVYRAAFAPVEEFQLTAC